MGHYACDMRPDWFEDDRKPVKKSRPGGFLDGCPFCGSKAILRRPEERALGMLFQAACQGCGASTRFFDSAQLAAQAWNRRAT